MNRRRSTRKLFLKISQYYQENTCTGISFLIKCRSSGLHFIKKRPKHRCFLANNEKLFATLILKNICDWLLLRVFLERFPTWTNNIGSENDVFSKTKQKKAVLKLSYMKKCCVFMMFFIILFFSISPLHARPRLPYIIKDHSSEGFKIA